MQIIGRMRNKQQKLKRMQKWVFSKQGLNLKKRIKPKISHFWLLVRANWLIEKERRREKKEKKKKEENKKRSARKAKVWNFVWKLYGIYICLDYVWIISMKKMYGMV